MKVRGRTPSAITIVIADGNRRLAEIMGQLLDDDHRFEVLAVVSSADAAVQVARDRKPAVVLVSQHLDGVLGVDACARLREVAPQASLLLWSHDTDRTVDEAPDVDGILERGMTYQDLARSIRDVRRSAAAVKGRVVDLTSRAWSPA